METFLSDSKWYFDTKFKFKFIKSYDMSFRNYEIYNIKIAVSQPHTHIISVRMVSNFYYSVSMRRFVTFFGPTTLYTDRL